MGVHSPSAARRREWRNAEAYRGANGDTLQFDPHLSFGHSRPDFDASETKCEAATKSEKFRHEISISTRISQKKSAKKFSAQ